MSGSYRQNLVSYQDDFFLSAFLNKSQHINRLELLDIIAILVNREQNITTSEFSPPCAFV